MCLQAVRARCRKAGFVSKFFEHTMWIAGAMDRIGDHQDEMWDEVRMIGISDITDQMHFYT